MLLIVGTALLKLLLNAKFLKFGAVENHLALQGVCNAMRYRYGLFFCNVEITAQYQLQVSLALSNFILTLRVLFSPSLLVQ